MGRKPVFREKICELLLQGASPNEIVKQLGCSHGATSRAAKLLRQKGVKFRIDEDNARRKVLYEAIINKRAQGMSVKEIAKELNMLVSYVSTVICRYGRTVEKVPKNELQSILQRLDNLEMQMEIILDLIKEMR